MTSRERVNAAFAHRAPDRTPYFEYVLLPPLADTLLGRPYTVDGGAFRAYEAAHGWDAAVRQTVRDRLDLAARLGHDLLYVYPTPGPAPAAGAPPPAPAPATSAPDDPVERVRRRNEAATRRGAAIPDHQFAVYHHLREEQRARGVDLPVLAPAYAHGVWTDVDLMQTMLLAPDVAHEHFALATVATLARVERYLALGLELIGVGGDFAGNRPLLSPAAYRAFIVPEVCRVAQRVHAGGARAVNASDGNLWSVIDDFLLGCEVDGYLEIDLYAGMDLARLKARFGDRITFLGNMDCGQTLSFATPAAVADATRACLAAGGRDGGHIFCASNAITASVPLANYLAMVNAYRDCFGLPPLVVG